MGLAGGNRPHPRAIIFDLDRCLIDSRNAWRYCVEESIAAATGERPNAADLVEEYHIRPWRDSLRILADSLETTSRCEGLCETMFARSAMKKLLVHEGTGMALDALRGERIELGAISRLPHSLAVKQVQSTGLDRFLAVVAATPAGEMWRPGERIEQCLAFLEAHSSDSAFVSGERRDLDQAEAGGLRPCAAGWASGAAQTDAREAIAFPGAVLGAVMRDWASRGASR